MAVQLQPPATEGEGRAAPVHTRPFFASAAAALLSQGSWSYAPRPPPPSPSLLHGSIRGITEILCAPPGAYGARGPGPIWLSKPARPQRPGVEPGKRPEVSWRKESRLVGSPRWGPALRFQRPLWVPLLQPLAGWTVMRAAEVLDPGRACLSGPGFLGKTDGVPRPFVPDRHVGRWRGPEPEAWVPNGPQRA